MKTSKTSRKKANFNILTTLFCRNRAIFVLSLFLYLGGVVAGIVTETQLEQAKILDPNLLKFLINNTGLYRKLDDIIFCDILLNNINAIVIMNLGSFLFGVSTFVELFFNGYALGII